MSKPRKEPKNEHKIEPKSSKSIFLPGATVFISSFCIMVLELVASRLIARHLGSSLYTWTAVIGVILAGITIGNSIGGIIADKFNPRKSISVLFTICSAACVVTVVLNNLAGSWIWLWHLSWPLHVFSHVSAVFLLPSALLGTISPVVAKMALDRGLPIGKTVGNIYACGAAGSIAGTFAAGYYLISTLGTITIIWSVGGVLLLMGILYWPKLKALYVWEVIFIALVSMATMPAGWAKTAGAAVALREKPATDVIYENESRYFYIAVKQDADNPNLRFFTQDKLLHSEILMNDTSDLQYAYSKIYAAVTKSLSMDKKKISVMGIGGGGYVYPRYIEKFWPGSRIDIVEIDPAVTEAAMRAFGLDRNTTINTINMDARNYVDKLLASGSGGIPKYDFIYGDAFNDYSVPFQLVTRQFNEKLSAILADDGVYLMNMIDIFDSGLFLGSIVNTLDETFPYVYVLNNDNISRTIRSTYVVIASKRRLDLKTILSQYKDGKMKIWLMDDAEIESLRQKSHRLVLTDNYSPVENLLAPVVRDSARDMSLEKYLKQTDELEKQGRFAESIEKYRLALKADPTVSVQIYNDMGNAYAKMGYLERAIDTFNKAVEYNEKAEHKVNIAITYRNLGVISLRLEKNSQAMEYFRKAAEGFRQEVTENPDFYEGWKILGDTLTTMSNFKAAAEAYQKALELNPTDPVYYNNLVRTLEYDGRYDEAIEVIKRQIKVAESYKQPQAVLQLQKYIKSLEQKKAKSGQIN
jgi:tetratricopeptide (TPR) repeat protein/MFS family permease